MARKALESQGDVNEREVNDCGHASERAEFASKIASPALSPSDHCPPGDGFGRARQLPGVLASV
jgi:hypothetical protein